MTRTALLSLLTFLLACDTDTAPTKADTDADADADADGFDADVDCDDADAAIHPDADETCDGIDNNCDGIVDDDALDQGTFYADADGDGYGEASDVVEACAAPSGYAEDSTDCDDADAAVHPGADETCDGIDNNCDGAVDEEVTSTFYVDADGDGYGDVSGAVEACAAPSGYIEDGTDCDDASALAYPGAEEICDGIDNDCDSVTTEDGLATFFASDGSWADWSGALKGAVTLQAEGTLSLCAGTWDANVIIEAPVSIVGAGPEVTILDGGGRDSVVAAFSDLVLEGVQLTNGVSANLNTYGSSTEWLAGGGLYCLGDHTVDADNIIISGNSADIGGGIMADGCTVALADAEVSSNSARFGGGINISEGTLTVSDSTISDNEATVSGGGVYSSRPEGSTISISSSLITGNSAINGGGLILLHAAEVTCADSTISDNTATNGSGVYINGSATLTATQCGFGEDDVYTAGGGSFGYDAKSTFFCDASGCE